jgi:hypothetical protein
MIAAFFASNCLLAQEVSYGIIQDEDNRLRMQAVAYPDFDSDNVTISTAVFTFLMPTGVRTTANLAPAPATGSFENITGVWAVQVLTPEIYSEAGLDVASLKGYDVYQVVLQNAPELENVRIDQPIPLFAFELADDCAEGFIHVLPNDGDIQQSIRADLKANFNNQMSISADDMPSEDHYNGNDPFSFELSCPLGEMVSSTSATPVRTSLTLQPNPAMDYTDVIVKSVKAGEAMLEIIDANKSIVFSQQYELVNGENTIRLDLSRLAAATYLLNLRTQDGSFQKKLVRVK